MREIRLSGSEGGVADNGHLYPYRGAAARMGRWWRFGPRGPLVLVGTVSHRPLPRRGPGASVREPIGILRGWELGSRGDGDL
jgi:hypothetical protein